jgi:nucleoside-diphosphate-sugar epimerase
MKIFIAGATGNLGRNLVRHLRAGGHTVVGLARTAEGEALLRTLGAESRQADLFDSDALARAVEGAEVVIHAATAIPLKDQGKPQSWAINDRIRRAGTAALTAVAAQIGARVYLQQSVVAAVRSPDGRPFDESAPPSPDMTTQSALEGEEIALAAGARAGFAVGVLRCGWFYGPDAPHIRWMGEQLRKRRLPLIGAGDGLQALLHIEDAASAFATAALGSQTGIWHVVDDQPVALKTFLGDFARHLGARPPVHLPVWLARWLVDEATLTVFTASTQTANGQFRQAFGWSPRFPTYREGLEQIIAAWRKEGFLFNQPGAVAPAIKTSSTTM